MVLLKLKCTPERRKAVVAVTLSTSSPTCSLSTENPSAPFQIVVTLRLEQSTQPGRAVTIRRGGTAFAPSPEGGGLDTLALGTFGGLISTENPKKTINFGQWKPHYISLTEEPPSPNLKERENMHFLTIPADGTVQVCHDLPISRMFKYESSLTKDDVKPGE
ncbi:MAG: hypothetical protein Q9183_003579, partial [Haloplaca sp. 2 TL-2023]